MALHRWCTLLRVALILKNIVDLVRTTPQIILVVVRAATDVSRRKHHVAFSLFVRLTERVHARVVRGNSSFFTSVHVRMG